MVWLPALYACVQGEPGRGVETAEVSACLSGPLDVTGETAELIVEGVAVAHSAVGSETFDYGVRCDTARLLFSVDDGTDVWTVAWGWSEGGQNRTPELAVTPGSDIRLTFRLVQSFGESSGFVIEQQGLLMAAVEVGTWGPALLGTDIPDLRVSEGDVTGSERDDCGRKVARQVLFDADTDLALEAVSSGELTVGGSPTTAWALAGWGWENLECTDLSGELSWAVFR